MALDHSVNLQRFAQFFRPGFLAWLAENRHVYGAFEATALDLVELGHKRLSGRAIVHGLRHFTPCRETSALGWKINDHTSPDLVRVFVILHPSSRDAWELRRPDWRAFDAALQIEVCA